MKASSLKSSFRRGIKKILESSLTPFNLKIKKEGVIIPVSNGIGITNFSLSSERWFNDLLGKFNAIPELKTGLFIDVGTNIGQTLIKLKRINKDLRYFGFEPNPHCFYYTTKLIEDNHWTNSHVFATALSDENKRVRLLTNNSIDAEGSIIENLRPQKNITRQTIINTVIFDEVFGDEDIGDVKIIKIDVEGAELKVLRGMRKSIERYRPIIVCEVLHANSQNELPLCYENNQALMQLLKSLRMTPYRLVKSPANDKISDFERIEAFDNVVFDASSHRLCDYLFIPEEKKHLLINTGR